MATMMKVALPVLAIAGAAFTGGTSLGLLGADAGASLFGAGAADIGEDALFTGSMASTAPTASWLGSTIASVTPYAQAGAAGLQVAGTVQQAQGEEAAGKAAKTESELEAEQLQNNANSAEGAAAVKEQQQNLQTAYVLSNARAAAAGQGGATTDPSTQNIIKTVAGQGRLRALTDMYEGQAEAQGMSNQAAMDLYKGQSEEAADKTKMYSTILGGASSLFDRYATFDKNQNNNNLPPWAQQ